MKLNKIFLAAALCLGMISCQEEAEWTPAPEVPAGAQKVYFQTPSELGTEIDPADNVTSHNVVVCRDSASAASACDIKINVIQNDSNKFTVPASVAFAAGQTQATITIGFENLQVAETYTLVLELDKEAINPYDSTALAASYALSITPIKWERGTGIYTDEIIVAGVGVEQLTWWVDYKITTLPDGTKRLVIINPYGKRPADGQLGVDENGIYNAWGYYTYVPDETTSWDITVNIDVDNVATLKYSDLGFELQGSKFFVANLQGGSGTFVPDSSLIFETGALALGYDGTAAYYAGLTLYLSLDAYLASQVVTGSGCEIEDFEGNYVMVSADPFAEEPVAQYDSVSIAYFADYGKYLLQGMNSISAAVGTFDDEAQLMHISLQFGDSITIEGVGYETILYPMTATGGLGQDDLIFIANEDGTITLDESSKSIGYFILLAQGGQPVVDAEGYVLPVAYVQVAGFLPAEGEGEEAAKLPAKHNLKLEKDNKIKCLPMLKSNFSVIE